MDNEIKPLLSDDDIQSIRDAHYQRHYEKLGHATARDSAIGIEGGAKIARDFYESEITRLLAEREKERAGYQQAVDALADEELLRKGQRFKNYGRIKIKSTIRAALATAKENGIVPTPSNTQGS